MIRQSMRLGWLAGTCLGLLASSSLAAEPIVARAAIAANPAFHIDAAELVVSDNKAQLAAGRARLAADAAARHQQQIDRIRASLPVEATAVLSQRATLRAQGKTAAEAVAAIQAPALMAAKGTSKPGPQGIGLTMDNNRPAPAANIPPDPVVSSLSVSEGDPGTPIMITGTNLRQTLGEVHIIVANGKDVVAPVTYWSDTQILTEVPFVNGIQAYGGYVYVKTADGKPSGLSAFHFIPDQDEYYLFLPAITSNSGDDMTMADSSFDHDTPPSAISASKIYRHGGIVTGHRGDDTYYNTMKLQNNWTVESCDIQDAYTNGTANVAVSECRVGTNMPFTKVHWAEDMQSNVDYGIKIVVIGPSGTHY